MVLAQWNGLLALWDLLRRQHAPVLTMQVCAEPLLRVRIHEQAGSFRMTCTYSYLARRFCVNQR